MTTTQTELDRQLRSARDRIGSDVVDANDDICGKVDDIYFEDDTWVVRYLVAKTGSFFNREQVLISPFLVREPELNVNVSQLLTTLTREQVENSPPIDFDAPIGRKYELELARHYRYPSYWRGSHVWGMAAHPGFDVTNPVEQSLHEGKMDEIEESSLRSINAVTKYDALDANNEVVGKVKDFIIGTADWSIRYLIIKTGSWLTGKDVVLSPDWVTEILWTSGTVKFGGLTKEVIKAAPEFDFSAGVNRDYEGRLFDYYGKPYYW